MTVAEFHDTYGRHKDVLYRFARRMTGSSAAAEDLVHDCFLALWRNGAAYRTDRGTMRSFLIGVTRNLTWKGLRKERPFDELEEDSAGCGPIDPAGRECSEIVARAVAGLPPLPYEVQPGWDLIELPKYPVIRKVKVGDTVAVDLLVNPRTGQKVVDYLTVARRPAAREEAARDFGLPDVELSLREPRVLVNDALAGNTPAGTIGQVVWLYLPGHGRFSLSLLPDEKHGFTRNGTASARTFTFSRSPDEYRVECAGPVVPGSGRYNLYVRHEPDWYPGRESAFTIGSNDRGREMTIRKP
jgi:RNA polymerase sigma factor (sigma-70 family)